MSLIPYTITALEASAVDSATSGKNVIAGAVCSLYSQPSNVVVILYDDAAGSNGSTTKTTGTDGQVVVYVPQGRYRLSVNLSDSFVTVAADAPVAFDTFANLELATNTQDYQNLTCRERANAEYILQPSGYVALAGDATLANGRVAALQITSDMDIRKFGAVVDGVTNDTQAVLDCALRSDYVICDTSSTALISRIDILSGQKFKNIKFKLADGTNVEALSCERNAVGCEFINVGVNGNRANNAGLCHGIRFNGSTDCKVIDCNIFDTEGQGIAAFTGDDSNIRLTIEGNKITNTTGDGAEIRGSSDLRFARNLISGWDLEFSGLQFQSTNTGVIIQENVFKDTAGNKFAIESAGTVEVSTFSINDNLFIGDYTGISGVFKSGTITDNTFIGGVSTWRSGLELAGEDIVINGNYIEDGTIAISSGGTDAPVINAKNIVISSNYVGNKGNNTRALIVGARENATGTPTSTNIKISGNTFDFTQATGTGGRCVYIGLYSELSQVDGIDITDNTIIGDGTTASTRGIIVDTLAGSGKVTVKGNRISNFANNVNLSDDNLARFILRNNDLEDFINNAFLDLSTTTVVTNQDNDV